MDAAAMEAERRRKAEADLPPLPPLLAQILAETRRKQELAKLGKDAPEEGKPKDEEDDGEAKPPSGPLLLEAPAASGLHVAGSAVPAKHPDAMTDSDSEAEVEAPLGPLDPARCRVHGPGFSGAAALQPVKLTLTARDSNGKRVREGGAHVLVLVEPAGAAGEEAEPIEAAVEDHGNGTYTATYAVPAKGNYQLHIEVNGEPVGDSPYPVFFSAAVPPPAGAPPPAAVPGMPHVPGMPAPPAPAGGLPLPTLSAAGLPIVTAEALRAATGQPGVAHAPVAAPPVSVGAELARMGIQFPPLAPEHLARMVIVAGLPAGTTANEVKAALAECGSIRSCTMAGTFAFLTFAERKEAGKAADMRIPTLKGQALRVERAVDAKRAAEAEAAAKAAAHNPYLHIQAAQMAQFQLIQQQQMMLAQQVATMRAAQRTGVTLPLPSAAPAPAAKPADGDQRRRSRSRERSRRDRSRSRSRSRDRRRRSRSRSRSRDRRHRSHKHKHRHHKERRRSRSKERNGRDDKGEAATPAAAADAPAAPKDELEALLDEFEG